MRQFKLTNAAGNIFDFMRKDALLSNVGGLGIGEETETQRLGNTFVTIKTQEEQPSPYGTIAFAGYEQFEEFRTFVRKGGLVLGYKPLNTWYLLNVTLTIEKTEIERESRMLICPVQFTALSPWYEKITEYRSEEDTTKGKIYPYGYNFTYSANVPGVIDINNGELPSYCKIHILGPCVNPSYTLTQGGLRIGTGKINVTVVAGRKIVINSDPIKMEIGEYFVNGEYIEDKYGSSDFMTERLLEIPPGASRVAFNHDGEGEVVAWMEVAKRV